MTLAGLIERSERTAKTLHVRGTEIDEAAVDRVVDFVGAHDIAVVCEDAVEHDAGTTLVVEDGSGVAATDSLADIDEYVSGWQAGTFGVERDLPELLRRLDDTYFRSYDKRRMVVASRIVEERAWDDGDGDSNQKAALLAQERAPNEFYGFWTFAPAVVHEVVTHLESTYVR